jgi:two-component system sensor histidine kinase RpfC
MAVIASTEVKTILYTTTASHIKGRFKMTSSYLITLATDKETNAKAQAKIRVTIGFPVILLMSLSLWFEGSPHGSVGLAGGAVVFILHSAYILAAFRFATKMRPFNATQLVFGTAVLDPLMLSAWLAMMGEPGALFVCFYLFTILGFGFRMGPQPMWVCQIFSILGFSVVMLVTPIWREYPIIGFSFLTLLIVVPLYATGLIKQLRDARAHAESESQAKSQLLAKVSHELRTPLSGIIASAQLMEAEANDQSVVKRAKTIFSLSKDLLLEINDLLDSAKYEADSLVLESVLFSLTDVTDQLNLTLESTAAAKGIQFTINMDERIQDMVQGDSHYLNRVLVNIAGNAVKFTDQGKVDVYVNLLENGSDYYRIRFGVRDTGIGIPKELHQHIFEPFFQASEGTRRKYGGTGLGMSIAKEIVTLMGGDLLLESEPGKGSHFYFDLKLPKVVKTSQKNFEASNAPVVYGKKILVADDNSTNLILIKELLERDRHQVTVANTGQEALDILSVMNFDLILLDYNMGDIDGSTVLQVYRFGKLDTAPAFFLTADTTVATADKLKDAGAVGVLHKPITSEALRQVIVEIFESEAIMTPVGTLPASLKPVPPQYIDYLVIEDLQTLCPRPEFLTEVLENATLDIERNCNGLVTALEVEDIMKIHDSAHALKGVSDSVGAVRLSALAKKLMKITLWDLNSSKGRWKSDILETKTQSVNGIQNVLLNQKLTHSTT